MQTLIRIFRKLLLFVKRLFQWIIGLFLGVVLLSILAVLALRWVNPISSGLLVERKIEAWQTNKPISFQRTWRGWFQISDGLKLAVIAGEDQNFPFHHGFDMQAIKDALKHNAQSDTLRGASTISQQVAKNVFLWSGRSWLRKGLEVWFTLWIELLWSKQRILEIYLNSVEWGEGIFGAEAAAQHYFQKSARELTKQQASLLATILPNPRNWSPTNPTPYIKTRSEWIQKQMDNLGGYVYLQKLKCTDDCKL